ncbi:MAG TPA: hypothetical protein VIV83_02575, partial [Gemmatimonadales bacterium]
EKIPNPRGHLQPLPYLGVHTPSFWFEHGVGSVSDIEHLPTAAVYWIKRAARFVLGEKVRVSLFLDITSAANTRKRESPVVARRLTVPRLRVEMSQQ